MEKQIAEAGDEVNPSAWSQVWIHYRAAAISILMADGDKKQFFQRLVASASARKHYLTLINNGQLKASQHYRASEFNPYFDAVIAGQYPLANEIASLSPADWNEDYEFEDDFCYAQFLFALVSKQGQLEASDKAWLTRFEEALEGDDSQRLVWCQAICEQDSEAAVAAILALHDEWQAFYKEKNTRIPIKDWGFLTEKALFMEGVALLTIMDRLKLPCEQDYPDMPSWARIQFYQP
ncbi:MAG: hypothetical protein L3J84_07055 [Gammaproteobacteria bacterium]|nr:hypothetical protein [Gammaproteobacteria bacterium]